MLQIYTVAFFGHRYIDKLIKVEELLEEQIRKLLDENEYVDFNVVIDATTSSAKQIYSAEQADLIAFASGKYLTPIRSCRWA